MSKDPLHYPEERRLATVLFADVHGFTPLAEQLDFEIVSDLIKGIWDRLDKIITAHNGYIDKHLGDGIMAVWGAPFAAENDAEQAVAAGLELQTALETFCKNSEIPEARGLQLRVGINSGLVFAGYVGTRNEYTVLGDTVNVAARLEQTAEPGAVVIGENTLRMVRASFRVCRLEPTRVKGKSEPIVCYAVEGRLAIPGRMRYQSVDSLITYMVGRESALQRLQTFYETARESNRPQINIINGDVGIGKSRLLLEFSNWLEQNHPATSILATRGLAQASRIPFYAWRIMLRTRFGVRDEDSLEAATQKWTSEIKTIWNGESEIITQKLGPIIGLPGDPNFATTENMQQVAALIRELLYRLARNRRVVIFFDDMQSADRESLQLLHSLLREEDRPLPLIVYGASRPEFLQTNLSWLNLARVLELPPLAFTGEMVQKAYPDLRDLHKSILAEIAQRADGNPYFLEEIVKSLVKSGALEQNPSPQEIQSRALAQMPESLRGTLQARLDSLSREARAVALLASVVGRVFWVGAVMAAAKSTTLPGALPLLNVPETVIGRYVQDGLRQLMRAELAFPRNGTHFSDQQEYIFKNAYLRDVAYGMIPNRNRAQYHSAVAEWMEKHPDPAYQAMATEHRQNARQAAKMSTGGLPALQSVHEH